MKKYKPLPNYLTVAISGINGLGLFALEDIPKGTEIGITHHHLWEEVVRTPLGGFINHSGDPNCELERVLSTSILYALKDIKELEELTLKYKTYKVEEKKELTHKGRKTI
jgi:SET domain-containing protein